MTNYSESAKMNRNVWNMKRERKPSLITIKASTKQNSVVNSVVNSAVKNAVSSAALEALHETFSRWVLIFMSLQKQPIYLLQK